jgi:hypothetical protein
MPRTATSKRGMQACKSSAMPSLLPSIKLEDILSNEMLEESDPDWTVIEEIKNPSPKKIKNKNKKSKAKTNRELKRTSRSALSTRHYNALITLHKYGEQVIPFLKDIRAIIIHGANTGDYNGLLHPQRLMEMEHLSSFPFFDHITAARPREIKPPSHLEGEVLQRFGPIVRGVGGSSTAISSKWDAAAPPPTPQPVYQHSAPIPIAKPEERTYSDVLGLN